MRKQLSILATSLAFLLGAYFLLPHTKIVHAQGANPVGCSSMTNNATSGYALTAAQSGNATGPCTWAQGAGGATGPQGPAGANGTNGATGGTGPAGFGQLVGSVACSGGAVCTTATGSAIVTSAGTTITFSSIPGTYNNLQLVGCVRTSRSATTDNILEELNGDSTAGDYNFQGIQLIGTSSVSANLANNSGSQAATVSGNTATANRQGCFVSNIPGYAGTTFQKNITTTGTFDAGASGLEMIFLGINWANTAAVTSIVVTPNVGPNFAVGSQLYLYGY